MTDLAQALHHLGATLPATRTTEIEVARHHIDGVFTTHALRATARAPINFLHRQGRLSDLSLNLLEYGGDIEVVAPPLPGFYLLQLNLAGHVGITSDRFSVTLGPGRAFVMNPGIAYAKRWSPDSRQLMLKVPCILLERRLAADVGDGRIRDIRFDAEPLDLNAGRGRDLLRLFAYLCEAVDGDDDGPFRRHLQTLLLSAMLQYLAHDQQARLAGEVSPAAPFYVRRAEQYLRAHVADVVTAAELAAAAGVAERTLQAGFRRFRDTTPGQYQRDLRLDLARQALLAADGRSVTQVALDCGFGHLGRFARMYQRRFGEAPSRTRARC